MSLTLRKHLRVRKTLLVLDLSHLWVIQEYWNYRNNSLKLVLYTILHTGSQRQNIHHCNLCCACKISAVWGSPTFLVKVIPHHNIYIQHVGMYDLYVYFPPLHIICVPPIGIPSWPSLPPPPVSYLWVVCPELVADRGPEFFLHCRGEGECAKQIPLLHPIWLPSGSQPDHRHWHCESIPACFHSILHTPIWSMQSCTIML